MLTTRPVKKELPARTKKIKAGTITKVWKNVVTRAELRWDHSLTGQELFGDGNKHNAVSLTADFVYRF